MINYALRALSYFGACIYQVEIDSTFAQLFEDSLTADVGFDEKKEPECK